MTFKRLAATAIASLCVMAHAGGASSADLVLPSEVAATHWKTKYMNQFAEGVAKRTNGALNVKVFPAGQLYNDQDALAALGTGAVHMVWPVAVRVESIEPRTGILNLPFAVSDEMMTNQCFSEGLTTLMSSYVEPRNLKILGFLRTADLFFVFRNRDVQKMEDLKGAKIRVTGGKVFQETMKSLNTSPVSMAASEMSTALAQGAIDGVYTSPAGWAEMIGMTGKYAWHVPGFSLTTYAIVVDKGWIDGLPEAQRKAIADTIKEIAPRQWKEVAAEDKVLIDKMVAQGAVFRTATPDETKRWRALAKSNEKVFSDKYPEAMQKLGELEKRCGYGN
ncbi:TRAP transporter substrate-binding protein DctP [Aromatoleum petrolei]|uniref:C4-dicarboxylate ABC transporter substrate-binding protein n=1 Tax=Aromatoleum petrolei TaxID=76116 RepID=A0ABX1MYL5_9RHOO|nr:TRAP transporter substrate-binding protein DctP [Aromatoleum petrolei]NMF91014.1 C4-dicarboxylate ABC transporter substrate-binding protein [Aromatoleum petrolei]QTQ35398.1 C4-dicarboxylate-binding periplasmic protein [Aromatoleum petrolei]